MADSKRIEGSLVREARTLEQAVAVLLGRFTKVLDAAEYCRVGPKQLSAYANPNSSDRYMPIDVVLDLERAAGDPIVTRCLAAKQHQVLFPLIRGEPSDLWDYHQREVVREGSEVFTKLTEALENEHISKREATDLLIEVEEALAAFAALRDALRARRRS